ncbi:glycosyltransferase family protein [Leptothoe sp. PORK10 BA2]|uniref:glycosyltransferase family protein n=1 Tax=Leptothoe sp. PORK10 BA2 TaxID=3110254 RepID=UPI002B1F8479|nr:glycosyltransferase [Leptothoe sp. PORK10 BA2]MEA5464363.1 glycosyltransferase [Leptothoe sp. PORK10 BA2]
MKTLLFYCQHMPGFDHLIRSMAIAHGLTQDFKVYFVNGGEGVQEFPLLGGIETINLPAIGTQPNCRGLQLSDAVWDMDMVLDYRRDCLLKLCDRIRPDVVMVERFPFDHHCFSPELIPLLERAKSYGAKIICSVRDIVVSEGIAKPDQDRHEAIVCQLMNLYFDQLLIQGDPTFIPLEASFSRMGELTCDIHYTGYVIPDVDREFSVKTDCEPPIIVASVGSGQFGHELLDCVAEASHFLEDKIPHHIQMFTGPFAPVEVYARLQTMASRCSNLTVQRYTPDLLSYLTRADLSISMAGYNPTLNVLQTGVRAIQLPSRDNPDRAQRLRSDRLEKLAIVKTIEQADLEPINLSLEMLDSLSHTPQPIYFCLQGVQITAARIKELVTEKTMMDCTEFYQSTSLDPKHMGYLQHIREQN